MKSSGIKLGKAKFRLSKKKKTLLIMSFIISGISLSGEMMETPV